MCRTCLAMAYRHRPATRQRPWMGLDSQRRVTRPHVIWLIKHLPLLLSQYHLWAFAVHPSTMRSGAGCTNRVITPCPVDLQIQCARQCQRTAPACNRKVWHHISGGGAWLEHGGWANIPVGGQVSSEPTRCGLVHQSSHPCTPANSGAVTGQKLCDMPWMVRAELLSGIMLCKCSAS